MLAFKLDLQFFAKHAGGGGSCPTNRNHDSHSKRLGIKKFGGEKVKGGGIIVCQNGTKWGSGPGTYLSRNYTIHAKISGAVEYFQWKKKTYVRVVSLLDKEK
ncbi:MAG: 50S ribosomal protein L27 [Candidatus Moeniiplasma glomeromycotorum]|nr:50S ribosomal protein L27 [Candidatus Moeniiplasma glomeromycotorum]MCE8167061.1 50S ribosomal protein L27 [Candidatus Moeniiplasma glomeromycotorum]MCE8168927.1 50S ribosomal protein L27 [Candidatus Moeniiplasma glomeromycotorum]